MWRHGEDGQEACALQKLPETGVRPVAQEQVGVCHILLLLFWITFPQATGDFHNPVVTFSHV